ncbi:MAG: type II toxin-antitoxin system HigB family toxin [Saprospiraceae bacterium]|nr:type II toxin-antitoxin system HigB family toxin [Candidatus Opimibacter skivensis]MBL0008716.1 type II toxin-antitoxin system HigB family toxin [Candidatus Opimibacter skivensis]MBP6680953.1 type II toxin-antitoxin system HigB family toxin [Saprospiraceae bacterium]
MRIIAKATLREYWAKHKDCEQPLKSWYREAEGANWTGPTSVKLKYPSASILKGNRVVFNIKGNTYRLVVRINYEHKIVWIRFIGNHQQYDKIDAQSI